MKVEERRRGPCEAGARDASRDLTGDDWAHHPNLTGDNRSHRLDTSGKDVARTRDDQESA
jgi:hypothetical protein